MIIGRKDFNNNHLFWIFCMIDSFSHHNHNHNAQRNDDKHMSQNNIYDDIVVIWVKIQFLNIKSNIAAMIAITKNTMLIDQSFAYHKMKSFSSADNSQSTLILFFMNGPKNIIPARAESLACDEMMFLFSSMN